MEAGIVFDVVAALRIHNKWIHAQVELKEENYTFLLSYLGLFPQIPTAKESQAGFTVRQLIGCCLHWRILLGSLDVHCA